MAKKEVINMLSYNITPVRMPFHLVKLRKLGNQLPKGGTFEAIVYDANVMGMKKSDVKQIG